MKNIFILFSLIAMFFITGCEDVVDVKVDEGTPALVVDGWITTNEEPYTVKLSKTGGYFNNTQTPRVQGAVVVINDNEGNSDTLIEKTPGEYVTKTFKQAKVGNTYTLNLTVEGERYVASSEVKRVPEIDSLKFEYEDDTEDEEDGYYLYYYGPEPAGQGDYYRFRLTKNDTLLNDPEDVWNVTSDEWVDGNYIGDLRIYGDKLVKGDKVKVEMLSITKDAYYFFTELAIQVNNGGMFSNPPANVRTNIKNLNPESKKRVIGYFGASGIRSKEARFDLVE